MSIDNPYQAPASEALHADGPGDREYLRRIAKAQRQVNIAVLMYLGLIPVNIISIAIGGVSPLLGVLVLVYAVVVVVAGAFSVFRLAAVFHGSVVAFIFMIAMLIPLVGLLMLLSVSGRATRELRAAGVKVGLMGADPNSI